MNFGDLSLSATPLIDWRVVAAFATIAAISAGVTAYWRAHMPHCTAATSSRRI